MAQASTISDDGRSQDDADAVLIARYSRLAEETTGMGRRILLRLVDEVRARQQHGFAETIELHLVPDTSPPSPDAVRMYR